MTFQEWLEDQHADPASTAWRSNADHLAIAYAAGRESMRQECADHVFNMAQWDENNEQWVVLHRAATAIRSLK